MSYTQQANHRPKAGVPKPRLPGTGGKNTALDRALGLLDLMDERRYARNISDGMKLLNGKKVSTGWGKTSIPPTAGRLGRVDRAVRKAWPNPRVLGTAAGAVANALLDEQLQQIDEALQEASDWLEQGHVQEPQSGLHPNLEYETTISGPEWGTGSGTWLRESFPFTMNTNIGGAPVDRLQASQNPDTYGSYGWATEQVGLPIQGQRRLGLPQSPGIWVYNSSSLRRYQRRIDLYRNKTGFAEPVYEPFVFTEPYVKPITAQAPAQRKVVLQQQQVIPLPRRVEEVYIDIHTGAGGKGAKPPFIDVRERPAQKPGRKTERKAAGHIAAASAALWAFEAASDWKDWIDIVIAANDEVPPAVRNANRLTKLLWLAANPESLATDTDWMAVAVAMGAWLIEERIGALIGAAQRNAAQNLGATGLNLGFGFSAWTNAFTRGIDGPRVSRGASLGGRYIRRK